jgi:hypothetical protein
LPANEIGDYKKRLVMDDSFDGPIANPKIYLKTVSILDKVDCPHYTIDYLGLLTDLLRRSSNRIIGSSTGRY